MSAKDGSGADSSQKLKPKVSKPNLKAAGGAEGTAKKPGAVSGLKPKVSGAAPKVSGIKPKVSGAAPKASGLAPKVSGKTPKVSEKSPKVSGKTPAAGDQDVSDREWAAQSTAAAGGKDSGSSSSAALKVKKKKSGSEGKALSPKKSSLRKSSPADAEPIKPTDDLDPVAAGDDLETPEEIDDTTVAYTEPPQNPDDHDGVTETYVLDTSKEKEEADKDEDADEDADDLTPPGEAVDEDEEKDAEEEKDEDEEKDQDQDKASAAAEDDDKPAKADAKASGRAKPSDRRRGRASKRTEGGEGDDKDQERTSKRSAAQKKANRGMVKLFLGMSIATIVGMILIPVVMWWKGMWPFDGNRPKEEAVVYSVPAYPGETFGILVNEFTPEANPESLLTEKNPKLPLDQPFTEKTRVTVGIPKAWKFRPSNDTSFIQHFLAEAQAATEKDPPDIGRANQNMLMARKMLDRFVLKGDNTDATKDDWKKKVKEVEDLVARASGDTPAPNPPPNSANNNNTPPPPPPPSQEEQNKKAKEVTKPVYENLAKIRTLLTDNKAEALALIKATVKQMDQLHDYHELQGIKAMDALLDKEVELQTMEKQGEALTLEDWDKVGFPAEQP